MLNPFTSNISSPTLSSPAKRSSASASSENLETKIPVQKKLLNNKRLITAGNKISSFS